LVPNFSVFLGLVDFLHVNNNFQIRSLLNLPYIVIEVLAVHCVNLIQLPYVLADNFILLSSLLIHINQHVYSFALSLRPCLIMLNLQRQRLLSVQILALLNLVISLSELLKLLLVIP